MTGDMARNPRLMTKKAAAAYCGVSVPTFNASSPPPPVRLGGRVIRYDVRALDAWIDGMGGVANQDDELERALRAMGA